MSDHLLQFKEIGINRTVAFYGEKKIPVGVIIDQPSGVVWSFAFGDVNVLMRQASDVDAAIVGIFGCLIQYLASPRASSARVLEHADSTRQECRE